MFTTTVHPPRNGPPARDQTASSHVRRLAFIGAFAALLCLAANASAQQVSRVGNIAGPASAPPTAMAMLATNDLLDDPGSPVIGNPNGDVTIVEFFDYRCPYCKIMDPRMMGLVAHDPKLRLVMKEYPILSAQSVTAARVALVAARHGKYKPFHEALYALSGPLDEGKIMAAAKSVGLDPAGIRTEMTERSIDAELQRTHALGALLGVRGTPAFVIDGAIIPGAVPIEELTTRIAAARNAAERKP